MTNEEAIESFKHSNKQAKVRLEVEKMRMDSGEIKELEFYIERNEMAIKALETIPKYKDAYNKGWDDGAKATYEHMKMCEEEQGGDLISRDAVWDVMQELWGTSGELIDRLMALPSVNPQEPKEGHWIIYDVHGHKACKCSECGKDAGYPCNDKYCRHCGTRIVKSQERSE